MGAASGRLRSQVELGCFVWKKENSEGKVGGFSLIG